MESTQQGERNLLCMTIVSLLLTLSSPAADIQIRLAGSGSTQCSGRVEIYHNSSWGTVCDDSWGINDAKVVCRQLDCGPALSALKSAHFGQGSGQIWLDNVACSGSEQSLTVCGHRGFGSNDCVHSEDAGVVCSDVPIRLSGSTLCSGRVEIYYSNSWGTVCDDNWDFNDAQVVCRGLNCGPAQSAPKDAQFGQGSGQIWLNNMTCSGRERSLTECQHSGFGTHNCGHAKDAGVVCSVSLPKLSISTHPAGEVTWGQDVVITCLISPYTQQLLNATFILNQISGSIRESQTSQNNSATFRLLQVDFCHDGSYQCQYQITVSGQVYISPSSDSVTLSVDVRLQQPNISLTSPNKGLVWSPGGAEVTWGYGFVLTCSINSSYPDGRFFLIFSGSNSTDTKLAVNHSASFNFPAAEFKHQGNYSCVYEVTMCSGKFTSAETAQIGVVIKFHLFLLVSSVAAGILLLLLLVSVVVCLVVRRRQKAKQNETLVQTQLTAWNKYEDEDEDEEEKDYVNVEPVVTNSKQTEQAGGVEDEYANYDDYKEEEIDDIYAEASEDVNVEGKREEQVNDKDSADDEDDYVNVTEPIIEQSFYGEDEDIYQNV